MTRHAHRSSRLSPLWAVVALLSVSFVRPARHRPPTRVVPFRGAIPSLRLDPPSIAIAPGGIVQLAALYDPDGTTGPAPEQDVTQNASWSSDFPLVASVSTGLVTADDPGAAIVTASYLGLQGRAPIQVPSEGGLRVEALASRVVAVSWETPDPAFTTVEYQTRPFSGPAKQGSFFPTPSMSPSGHTRVLSQIQDLCPGDLTPGTLYYARVWNRDAGGNEIASSAFAFTTPHPPATGYAFTRDWYGLQLSQEWRSLDEPRRQGAIAQDYIRIIEALQQWDEIEPDRDGPLQWDIPDGLDSQLAEVQHRADLAGKSKFLRLLIRAGGAVGGNRMPPWAADGVETLSSDDEDNDKVVRWDPQYNCRYWKMIRAAGARYDPDPRVAIVPIQSISKTGEMTMSASLVDGYRALGYSDAQIAENMKWLYRNSLLVYSEAFPHKRLTMNLGRIPVSDGGGEVGDSILDALAAAYGRRLGGGVTGFGGDRAGLLTTYRTSLVVGGFSEKPASDSTDPVGELTRIFDLVWPHAECPGCEVGWVSLKDDALGILPKRWGDLPELKTFLNQVEQRFAQLRQRQ